MTTLDQPDPALEQLLRTEIRSADALLSYLQDESAKLASDNPLPEETDHSDKIQLIEAMQEATRARVTHMTRRGLSLQGVSLVDTALAMPRDSHLQPLISELARLAQRCFEENRLIGQLINRRSQFVTRMLDSLSPQSRNPHAEIYEANGNTSSSQKSGLFNLAQ